MARPRESVPSPPLPGQPGGLGAKIEATFERAVSWVIDTAGDALTSIITAGIELVLEALAGSLATYAQPIAEEIRDNPATPDYIKAALKIPSPTTDSSDAVMSFIYIVSGVLGGFMGLNRPAQRLSEYMVDRELYSARPDPVTAIAAGWRTGLTDDMRDHLRDLGWHASIINALEETVRPRPAPVDLVRDARLEGTDLAEVRAELMKRGYTGDGVDKILNVTKFVPGAADLVRMALREAWRDDVAARWGYDSDFPPEFAEWMQKQGDEDDWARKYWRAHWDLPGLATVLDMLYRVAEFTTDDLDTYLRISDIPATWRDYIKQTAYRPLTRVDVRRMYGMGVLDQAAVKKSYLDLGYDETNATHMTEFTVRYETETDREATKADILSFYKVGSLTADEATTWLQAIGYPADLASYLVSREQMKAEQAFQDQQKKHIRNLYIHAELTSTEASARLASIGVPAGEITSLLDQWQIDREAKVERPTRATLDKLFRQDVVTEGDYTAGLDALGYQQRYVDWYLDSILQIKTEEARKEEERARSEQESVRTRRIKSDYQIAKAAHDVDVAEVQTAIAETQLAYRARLLRYQDEARIAREAVSVVELREIAARDVASLETQIGNQEGAIAFLDEQIDELQTQIAEIKLLAVLDPPGITEEEADIRIRELQLAIELGQDDIAGAEIQIVDLRNQILARRVKLDEDLRIAVRIRSIEEIESDWRTDQTDLTARLSEFRVNLSELREQKALLAVEYREGLATPA